jgi:poly(3-hydroxybutyrate) depolymerase
MLYHFYELNHALISPTRAAVNASRFLLNPQWNPFAKSYPGKVAGAAFEVFDRLSKRYEKPSFDISSVDLAGQSLSVTEETTLRLPFANLLRFKKDLAAGPHRDRAEPKVLLAAPLSGHYATLLRGTVRALLPDHDVYITDWQDARDVSLSQGDFDLDDYIDYVMTFIRELGDDVHVIAVCQPGPAVVAATALMSERRDPATPSSVTLIGSPIDTRMSPTQPNELAMSRPLEWFERNVIMRVPFPHRGLMRRVYPGFLQLGGFMTMNIDRHLSAHQKLFSDLVVGDGESAASHRKFYDEYLSVMDLPAEYYLQTIDVVFQRHALPQGNMQYHGERIDPRAIERTALFTIEGELDDISGIGQTQAAHELFCNVPEEKRFDYVQNGAGHYGVFNGSLYRSEIAPRIKDFISSHRN